MSHESPVTPELLHALLTSHIAEEEDMFRRGEKRMEAIEQELQPLKKMYWAVIGSAGVGSILLTLLISFYVSDRGDMKDLSKAVIAQGIVLERIAVELKHMNASDEAQSRAIDSLRNGHK